MIVIKEQVSDAEDVVMIIVMMRMIMRPVPLSSWRMLRCSLSSQPLVMLRMLR